MIDSIKKLFWVSRPISWVNTAYPFAAAYLLTMHRADLVFLLGSVYFLIPYNLLMYGLNDVFDYESDRHNDRKGGVEGALLAKNQHRLVLLSAAALNLLFLVALYFLSPSPLCNFILTVVIFFVLAYSLPVLRFKERAFVDSMTSSLHFVGPLVFGLSFYGFTRSNALVIISFFLWGMASHAFGAVQDINADRAGGIGSIATVIGAKNTVRLSAVLYLTSGVVISSLGGLAIVAGFVNVFYIANLIPFIHIVDADADIANKGWKRFLRLNYLAGFIITMILIVIYKGWL